MEINTDFIIRAAKEDDAERMLDYIKLVAGESNYLTFGIDEFDVTLEEERRLLKLAEDSKRRIFLIAEDMHSKEVLGLLSFLGYQRKRRSHIGELGISVRITHWRKGIGRALFNALFEWVEMHKVIRKITLQVRHDHERAIAMYGKAGFSYEGKISRGMLIDGIFYDMVVMGKEFDFMEAEMEEE